MEDSMHSTRHHVRRLQRTRTTTSRTPTSRPTTPTSRPSWTSRPTSPTTGVYNPSYYDPSYYDPSYYDPRYYDDSLSPGNLRDRNEGSNKNGDSLAIYLGVAIGLFFMLVFAALVVYSILQQSWRASGRQGNPGLLDIIGLFRDGHFPAANNPAQQSQLPQDEEQIHEEAAWTDVAVKMSSAGEFRDKITEEEREKADAFWINAGAKISSAEDNTDQITEEAVGSDVAEKISSAVDDTSSVFLCTEPIGSTSGSILNPSYPPVSTYPTTPYPSPSAPAHPSTMITVPQYGDIATFGHSEYEQDVDTGISSAVASNYAVV